jgi:hypothetical protein
VIYGLRWSVVHAIADHLNGSGLHRLRVTRCDADQFPRLRGIGASEYRCGKELCPALMYAPVSRSNKSTQMVLEDRR